MDARAQAELAAWLAEAFETGNALAPLPASHLPPDLAAGEAVAALVLEQIGIAPCGIRVAPGPGGTSVAGPVLEGRLLEPARPVALAALRHPQATAAVVGVLAEELPTTGDGPPRFAALHPAIDIAAGRMREPAPDPALLAADLGGIGQIIVGRRCPCPDQAALQAAPVTLAHAGRRPRPVTCDLLAGLEAAAAAARSLGGLPAGALLVVAGFGAPHVPVAGDRLNARIGVLGRVQGNFV